MTNLSDIKALSVPELQTICEEIRAFLIESISKTGGHIGANLGTIELTVALHHVFESPQDRFLFDTGHQGYTQKILTGRQSLFPTLNQPQGMSRFLGLAESIHDTYDATHAGTAISTAIGIAKANRLNGSNNLVVAVVGDGSLVEGISFEGLNYGMLGNLPLIIVVNDNGMAIAPNVGGIHHLFSQPNWQQASRQFFEGLGYQYLAVPDGHEMAHLIQAFQEAKTKVRQKPIVVHVKTTKGKGLPYADTHKYRMHFSMPFNAQTGEGASATITGETYASVAAKTLYSLMEKDQDIITISPATPYASSLDQILTVFPDRALDVGMAEQHAASMACGLALQGKKPVVCYQSTFMQRAMDQIIHDMAFMKLPVTLLAVRSGFAGYDGPTHHGIYDLSYLPAIPNLNIFYAGTRYDLDTVLRWRLANPDGPMVILHPYENVSSKETPPLAQNQDITQPEIIGDPAKICILGVSNCLETALSIREKLISQGEEVCYVNPRWIKPFPEKALLPYLEKADLIVTLEENISTGGFGSRVATMICDYKLNAKLYRACISDSFVRFGDKQDLSHETGIDAESILEKIHTYYALT